MYLINRPVEFEFLRWRQSCWQCQFYDLCVCYFKGVGMMFSAPSCHRSRNMWFWCVWQHCSGHSMLNSWIALERLEILAGLALIHSKPSVSAARWACTLTCVSNCEKTKNLIAYFCILYLLHLYMNRSGTILTFCLRPVKRKIQPVSRIWTWMTSLLAMLIAQLIRGLNPVNQAAAKENWHFVGCRTKQVRLLHMNG